MRLLIAVRQRFENQEVRERLLNSNEKVHGQNQKLQEANKVAYEAEQLAGYASTNLRGQRDMIVIGVDEVTYSIAISIKRHC